MLKVLMDISNILLKLIRNVFKALGSNFSFGLLKSIKNNID